MNRWKGIALGLVAAVVFVPAAMGQGAKSGSAETGLLGVKLYDKNLVLIQKFGSPDDVQSVSVGVTTTGGAPSGAPGGLGGPAGPGGGNMPGAAGGPAGGFPGARGKGGGGGVGSADLNFPIFGDGSKTLDQKGSPGASLGPGAGGPPGGGMMPGAPGGPPTAGGGAPGASGGGGNTDQVTMTRWVYNRNNNKYGFVIDKFGRIVQIEAVGLENKSVGTKRGIVFGSSFAQVLKAYQNPDAYEINGDTIVLRYLSRSKVAFRLSRLGTKKPHVVTGIVVAASKG